MLNLPRSNGNWQEGSVEVTIVLGGRGCKDLIEFAKFCLEFMGCFIAFFVDKHYQFAKKLLLDM